GRKSVNPQQFLNDIEAMDDSNSIQYSHSSLAASSINSNDLTSQQITYAPHTASQTNLMTTSSAIQYTSSTYPSYPTCYRCYTMYTNIF
ncbi:unnamed protein product, partial [Rotaria socialis]